MSQIYFEKSTGQLQIVGESNPLPVSSMAGGVASGVTDSGNPVKVGGKYNSTPIELTNGQRGDLQLDSNGRTKTTTRPDNYAVDDSNLTPTPNLIPVGGVYRSTASIYSSGDATVLQSDVNGNTKVTLATAIAGEDLTNNILVVEQRYSFVNVTADTAVKSGAGFLHTVTIMPTDTAATAGTIILYDNTAESGTLIGTIYINAAAWLPVTLTFDCSFSTGLYVGFTTTNDVNVTVSYR